jgi:hypothetical protein
LWVVVVLCVVGVVLWVLLWGCVCPYTTEKVHTLFPVAIRQMAQTKHLLCFFLFVLVSSVNGALKAGVAKINGTLPMGTPLAGYNHGARFVGRHTHTPRTHRAHTTHTPHTHTTAHHAHMHTPPHHAHTATPRTHVHIHRIHYAHHATTHAPMPQFAGE